MKRGTWAPVTAGAGLATILGLLPAGAIDGQSARLVADGRTAVLAAGAVLLIVGFGIASARGRGDRLSRWATVVEPAAIGGAAILAGRILLDRLDHGLVFTARGVATWLMLPIIALLLWRTMSELAARRSRAADVLVPLVFGGTLVFAWEVLTRGFQVPPILLPPPSIVFATFVADLSTLWVDFEQTFVRSAVPGFAIGSAAGFLTAVAIDRSPFLQRGLLPLGSLVSAMPIVGIAPIMVMWFGFDWQSKAAVVVVMTFFPMLVNATAGLQATDAVHRDLMRSYAAGYWQTLVKLRLPGALPFLYNALKLNATLALIGAIVAEFFGTPIYGMGFRISTEVARLNVDKVWATIAVAAMAGSASYAILALLERLTTFWHPSQRRSDR